MISVLKLLAVVANLFVTVFAPILQLIISMFLTPDHDRWSFLDRNFFMISILTYFMNTLPTSGTKAMFAIAIAPIFSIIRFTSLAPR
jgi:hypothetical protein